VSRQWLGTSQTQAPNLSCTDRQAKSRGDLLLSSTIDNTAPERRYRSVLLRRRRELFTGNSPGFVAPDIDLDRLLWSERLPRWVQRAGACAVSPLLPARLLRMGRGLVGVAQGSSSLLVIKVPGRPRTAAALTGVPFRIACVIGLVLPQELRAGMREGLGTNERDSQRAGAAKFPGIGPDKWDGVGGSEARQWKSAPVLVTETTLPEPSSTKRPFWRS
jgi:hypothetical protein